MNEEMRKEFEKWIISNNNNIAVPNFIMKNDNGAYVDPYTAMLWEAWKASREAMKPIKLPDFINPEVDDRGLSLREMAIHMDVLKECRQAIESAGYKVAP